MSLIAALEALVEAGATAEMMLSFVRAWERENPFPTGRLGSTRAASMRRTILERDAPLCVYCGCEHGPFEVDHRVPLAKGGGNDLTNLVVACRPCNRSKGGKTVEEWGGRKWR